MEIALSEAFIADLSELSLGLQKKCRSMISSLMDIEAKFIRESALPGWRLHKLESSPFLSLSLDMNFRVLAKLDGNKLALHRVVKHSLADSPRVNRNDNSDTPVHISESILKAADIHAALLAIGLPISEVTAFQAVHSEEDLLEALVLVDEKTANYALSLYEMSGVVIPRSKLNLLTDDQHLEEILKGDFSNWELYLHPSQQYLTELPGDLRLAVSGSAGTGKTVCAWYRLKFLAKAGLRVGFVAPNDLVLKISKDKLEALTSGLQNENYFLVPTSANQVLQLAQAVDHLIIDEGQEFPGTWYKLLAEYLRTAKTGVTCFYDLNQLWGNYQSGDSKRYQERINSFLPSLNAIPKLRSMKLFINYRNSSEIAKYYYSILKESLPNAISSEIPVFSSGDVIVVPVSDISTLPLLLADTINRLRVDYKDYEIALLYAGGNLKQHIQILENAGIPISTNIGDKKNVVIAKVQDFRGYEQRAVLVVKSKNDRMDEKIGKAINFYIGVSRARERLIVFEHD